MNHLTMRSKKVTTLVPDCSIAFPTDVLRSASSTPILSRIPEMTFPRIRPTIHPMIRIMIAAIRLGMNAITE